MIQQGPVLRPLPDELQESHVLGEGVWIGLGA